jgi:D-glycero-D-manno-heptose 1,7-bisphosphate phosphatase
MNKAAFLDRDGVINRKMPEGRYVTRWDEMHFLPGVASAIARLKKAGFLVIVVSNQRCVAKGLVTAAEVDALHHRMCVELTAAGAIIDAVYYCPHEMTPPCNCRKPAPGMLLSAAREHGIDLVESWMIGDSCNDVAAGKSAGCRTALLVETSSTADCAPDLVAKSLFVATETILRSEELSPIDGRR